MARRNKRLMIIGFLFIAISFLLFGFAALSLSSALMINGVKDVSKPSWDVHIENLENAVKSGYAQEVFPPNFSFTTISNFSISLKNPDDSIAYSFKVINDGEYDAKISNINVSQPSCIGSGSSANSDAINVCNSIVYNLKYKNGKTVNIGDLLESGKTQELILTVSYDGKNLVMNNFVNSDVTISDLKITITYSQL